MHAFMHEHTALNYSLVITMSIRSYTAVWPHTIASHRLNRHTHSPLIVLRCKASPLIFTRAHSPTCAFDHSDSPWSESVTLLLHSYCLYSHTHMCTLTRKVEDVVVGSSVSHLAPCPLFFLTVFPPETCTVENHLLFA